ncbi:MAG: hypothetical protein NZ990_06600 [Myxococcota bacterium]|nr:hypothetical protein [Myxococcota bacterium]
MSVSISNESRAFGRSPGGMLERLLTASVRTAKPTATAPSRGVGRRVRGPDRRGVGIWVIGLLWVAMGCGPDPFDPPAETATASAVPTTVLKEFVGSGGEAKPEIPKAPGEVLESDPLAAFGHGEFIGTLGQVIEPTPGFIRSVQALYIARLEEEMPGERVAEYQELRPALEGALEAAGFPDGHRDSWLIDLLIGLTEPPDAAALRSKNAALRFAYGKYFEGVYELPKSVVEMLEAGGILLPSPDPVNSSLTYIEECREAGVPIPPDWGTPGWGLDEEPVDDYRNVGMPLENEFVAPEWDTRVWTFESESPPGVCIALPRWNGTRIELLGIICLGRESSNVCFWDQKPANPVDARRILDPNNAVGKKVPLEFFVGGPELARNWGGGQCTDCHAGENPFVVHPSSPLDDSAQMPPRWYRPLVDPSWVQNPGPTNLLAGLALDSGQRPCTGCHSRGAEGRFPEVSSGLLPGYCGVVLYQAINKTMPPSAPIRPAWEYIQHSTALYAACGLPPLNGSTIEISTD